MKEHTSIIILCALIISMTAATITANRTIRKNGGEVQTVFNTPLKEIFKP